METPRIFAGDLLHIQVLGLVVFCRIGTKAAAFGVLEISADADFLILGGPILTVEEKVAEVVTFSCLAIAATIVAQADIGLRAGAGVISISRAYTLRFMPAATTS